MSGRRVGAPLSEKGRPGSLVVVGIGLMLGRHTTTETLDAINGAEHVFHLLTNPAAETWIQGLHPRTTALGDCFKEGKSRTRSYAEMAERIVDAVRAGEQVCAAFYGHPGVLVSPAYQALVGARRAGYPARMLPGISAEDCLFADLAIDPRGLGWQSYEASDFLLRRRRFDPTVALILWQAGVLGEGSIRPQMQARSDRVQVLIDKLAPHYPPRHPVIVYEASEFPITDPVIERVPLRRLATQNLYPKTTLYVPPRPPTGIQDARVARWFTGPQR
jgi:tetrapyrrole (corrin/porphyrin) methylase-like protein